MVCADDLCVLAGTFVALEDVLVCFRDRILSQGPSGSLGQGTVVVLVDACRDSGSGSHALRQDHLRSVLGGRCVCL